jgi:hypothetical protein
MKIDVFPHILPRKYFERLLAVAPPGLALQKRMSGIPGLVDLDLRFAMMDRWEGYVQVLTLGNPPIEVVAPPRRESRPGADRQRRDGGHRGAPPRPFSRFCRLAAHEQSRGHHDRAGSRHRRSRRHRRADLQQRQRPAARPAGVRADLRPHGPARAADLGCTPPVRPHSRTMPASRGRNTISDGRSAGRPRPAWPWGAWSSPASSTATPGSS